MVEQTESDPAEPSTPSGIVAARIKGIRTRQGLTAQAVSDRLAGVGVHLSRATLAKIEAGLREASLDEACAIALVLNVALVELLSPAVADDDTAVMVAPGHVYPAPIVRQWILGVEPLPSQNYHVFHAQAETVTVADVARALRVLNRFRTAQEQVGAAWDLDHLLAVAEQWETFTSPDTYVALDEPLRRALDDAAERAGRRDEAPSDPTDDDGSG